MQSRVVYSTTIHTSNMTLSLLLLQFDRHAQSCPDKSAYEQEYALLAQRIQEVKEAGYIATGQERCLCALATGSCWHMTSISDIDLNTCSYIPTTWPVVTAYTVIEYNVTMFVDQVIFASSAHFHELGFVQHHTRVVEHTMNVLCFSLQLPRVCMHGTLLIY